MYSSVSFLQITFSGNRRADTQTPTAPGQMQFTASKCEGFSIYSPTEKRRQISHSLIQTVLFIQRSTRRSESHGELREPTYQSQNRNASVFSSFLIFFLSREFGQNFAKFLEKSPFWARKAEENASAWRLEKAEGTNGTGFSFFFWSPTLLEARESMGRL